MELAKALVGYAATSALSFAAARYHLTDAQVSAIVLDVGTLAAAALGVRAHMKALATPPPKS